MIPITARIDGFFNRNISPKSLQRGRAYFTAGNVNSVSIKPLQRNIFLTVQGELRYQVLLNVDIHSVKLIYGTAYSCPYSGEGLCKHIAAAGFWLQANWDTVVKSFDTNQEFTWPAVIDGTQASIEKVEKGCVIKNFKSLTREVLYRSVSKRNLPQLSDYNIRQTAKGEYDITVALKKMYFRNDEIHNISAIADNIDLKLSCHCKQSINYVCDHILAFLQEATGKQLRTLFTDLEDDFVEKKGADMLRIDGFESSANWKDYFEIGFADKVKTLIPKASLSNLISPELWSLDNPGSSFSINPNHHLGVTTENEKTEYEMGFYLQFDAYGSHDLYINPIVGRPNRKGEPMSIGIKDYDKVRFSDHVIKQHKDVSLLAMCNALVFGCRSTNEKIDCLLKYKTELEEHPYLFLNTSPSYRNFRKIDLIEVKFQSGLPRLKYILTEKDGFVEIRVVFHQDGKELFCNAANLEDLHRNFLKCDNYIYFLASDVDVNHLKSARNIDGKMLSLNKLPKLFEQYLSFALKSSDVEFVNFKKYAVTNQTVQAVAKEIYLSEVGNFVLFRPFIRYENDYLMDAQESQWEVSEDGIVQTEQDMEKAIEFRNELCEIYPAFKEQFSRTDYLHISYRDLLYDNAFSKIFGKLDEKSIKVFGVRDLKGLKVNPFPG